MEPLKKFIKTVFFIPTFIIVMLLGLLIITNVLLIGTK